MNLKQLFISACLLVACCARVKAATPSTNDLWDIHRGVSIIAQSSSDQPSGGPFGYDIANIFGATNGTYFEATQGNLVFTDNRPDGFVHFVEWETPAPVTVRSFRLFAGRDPNGHREFASFRLLAKSPTSNTFDQVLYSYTPTHPYSYLDAPNWLLVESNIKAVTAKDFRAEFVNLPGLPLVENGPRIIELDGFGTFINVKPSIRVSEVEMCWDTVTGVKYQVEYSTEASGSAWTPLGTPIEGTGQTQCVSEPTDSPTRYYRVRPID